MTPSSPYLFVEIWVPKCKPYNDPKFGWPSIVGDFVKPLVKIYPDLLVWFLQEGSWWQLCFAYGGPFHLKDVNETMKKIANKKGFKIKRYIRNSTLGGALGGSRWLPVAKQGTKAEAQRSFLLTQACHAVCAVYLDTLIKKGNHWEVQSPECKKQNPHGNLFESFTHLVANITEAKFDVKFEVRTGWMAKEEKQEVKATCHL